MVTIIKSGWSGFGIKITKSKWTGIYPRSQPTEVRAVLRGVVYVPAPERLVKPERVSRFIVPHSFEMLMKVIEVNFRNRGKGMKLHLPKNLDPKNLAVGLVKTFLPLAVITTSLYSWKKRLSKKYQETVSVLMLPPGALRIWTQDKIAVVSVWLKNDKNSLGEICRKLNAFGIKMSVRGLVKWRLREIKGPPPVFVW